MISFFAWSKSSVCHLRSLERSSRATRSTPLRDSSIAQHIIWATATNISSLLADLKRGDGRSELEFINHQLIRAAADHGVPVPINQKIHDQAAAVFLESRSA